MFRLGARVEGRYVQVLSTPAQQPSGRVGYVISRKVMPRAVDRNRLKRRLREFLRNADSQGRELDMVIRVKRPIPAAAMDEAFREACALIDRAIRGSDAPAHPR